MNAMLIHGMAQYTSIPDTLYTLKIHLLSNAVSAVHPCCTLGKHILRLVFQEHLHSGKNDTVGFSPRKQIF